MPAKSKKSSKMDYVDEIPQEGKYSLHISQQEGKDSLQIEMQELNSQEGKEDEPLCDIEFT